MAASFGLGWRKPTSASVRSGERQRDNVSARGRRSERSTTVRDDQSLVASRRNYARVSGLYQGEQRSFPSGFLLKPRA